MAWLWSVPHRRMRFNTCSPDAGAALVGGVYAEEVSHLGDGL